LTSVPTRSPDLAGVSCEIKAQWNIVTKSKIDKKVMRVNNITEASNIKRHLDIDNLRASETATTLITRNQMVIMPLSKKYDVANAETGLCPLG
jgi:hypothetical protein